MTFDDWTKKQREKNKGSSQRNTQRKGEDVAAATFSVGGMNGSKPVTNTGKSTSKRNVQVTVGNPATYGNTKNKSSTKKSTSPANKTFDQWTAEQRAGGNARSWAQGVSDLVNEAGSYYSSWSSDADKRTRDFQERAAAYMSAANKYKGSFQNASDYEDLYSALKNVTPYASQMGDMYSNFYSQKQYDQAVQVASWQKKYQNYSYSQKRAAIEKMKKNNPSATLDERKWLEQNIDSGMTAKDYDEYIKDKQRELEAYNKTWDGKSSAVLSDPVTAANEWMAGKKAIQDEIDRVKSKRYMLEKQDEYAAVKNNADFSRFSKVKPAGNVLNGGDIREIISDPHKEHGSIVTDWSDEDWTQDEIDTATYIYNTQGKKAAQAYWDDYLKYVVLERADKRKRQEYADYATRNVGTGILASLGSVGATLASGQGLLSVAGQNIRNKLVGDEGYRPINYYGNAFDATRKAASTRGAISEYLDKEYGTIQLDEQKNPFWSKLLNGKGAGFAYQTAMSMADSGALAALTMGLAPAIGEAAKFTTVLLGGSAGSQGVLDALERGASDEQALMMGILNGTFEALFEEVSLDHLIHPDKNFLVNLLKQGFIEGSEEVSTSFMNNIADIAIMASNSEYMQKAQEYMDQGFSEEEALRKALASIAVDIGWDFVGGAISGGLMGGMSGARATIMRNGSYANLARGMEAQDVISDLQSVDPNSKLAARMQTKLDNRGDLSTWNKSRMLNQTEQAVLQRDAENVRSAVVDRLTELGETANVDKIADAIVDIVTAQQMNEEASRRSARAIEDSTYGNRVLNELASENSEGFSAEWTKGINTEILGKANQDVYMFRRAVRNFINKNEESLAEEGYNVVRDENGNAIGLESAMPEEAPADINELSRKYGKGYQTFLDNYEEGQDVESYDQAFGDVYQMGNSGLTLESAKQAMEGSIFSESQIKAAYQAGRDAADAAAAILANENRGKALQTNKKGWRRGSVSADGVTMKDLDTAFQQIASERGENVRDFVRKSIDLMRTISEATGIDVVLYRSSADEDGKFRGAQGRYEWKDSKIYVDINAGLMNISDASDIGKYIMLQTFTHEFVHFMEQWSPAEYNELRDLVMEQIAKSEDVDALIRDKQRRLGGDISYDEASREVVADGLSRLLPQSSFVENLAAEHQNVFQRLLERLKQFLADIKEHFAQLGKTNQREIGYLTEDVDGTIQYVQDIVDLFDYVAQNAVENYQNAENGTLKREEAFRALSFQKANQYIEAGLPVAPEAEVEWSIRTNEEQMDNTEKYVSNNGERIPKSTLDAVRALRTEVAAYLEKYASKLNLPNEVIGNPFVKNGSYDISYDPTTVCVRSLGVLRLQQLVSERLGRPLTARENFEIAQEAFEWTDNPQCLYCFAALDRMAKSEYLMDFVNRQNRAVKALNDGAKKSDAYQAFLPDGHKGSTHMRKVFNGIYDRWKNKGRLLTLKDVATYDKLNELVNRDEAGGIGELAYWANQYAQNASWAKAQRQYQAYNGNILKWSEDMIKTLNSHYGLRLNSHSEFSPAFILEYLQIYTDAAARGLKALEYTSDINAAKIFAPTGAAINMSISIVGDSYDNMGMDAMQGCDWTEARAVRDKYPNAGIVAVALNDEQTRWALDQDWIDVVIPMHLVKTGDEIAKYMNWTNTKAISDDKKQKGKWDKDRDESHIYPSLHLNDKETYLRQLKANHLTPRFEKWLDHPGYMKLVNETRQATTEMKPLQPVFDEDALWSAIHMMEARGGYFERLGHTEEGEEYIADEMTERFKKGPRYFEGNPRGKAAADVLGRENVEYSKRDSEGNELTDAQQEFFKDSKARDKNGDLLRLYSGTATGGFTTFRDGKIWLTTVYDSARAYGGAEKGNIFAPSRGTEITTDSPISVKKRVEVATTSDEKDSFFFDSQEDLDEFEKKVGGKVSDYMDYWELSDYEYEADDAEYEERKRLSKAIEREYAKYNRAHLRQTTIAELLKNPDAYLRRDFVNAVYAIDSNAAIDEDGIDSKQDLIDGLLSYYEEAHDEKDTSDDFFDIPVLARVPEGTTSSSKSYNDTHTVYAMYANTTHPYIVDNGHKRLNAKGSIYYQSIDYAYENTDKYDGVIINDVEVGPVGSGYGTAVIVFHSNQVKSVNNQNPTYSQDIQYSKRVTDDEYMQAVESGDMETAQRLVDEKARETGYTIKVFHGTPQRLQSASKTNVTDSEYEALETDYADKLFPYVVFNSGKRLTGVYTATDRGVAEVFAFNFDRRGTVYDLYAKSNNPLRFDANGNGWNNISKDIAKSVGFEKSGRITLEDIAKYAKGNGYDAVIVDNVRETGSGDEGSPLTTDVIVFDSSQLKSADPVTYDDSGNVIPLTERFNHNEQDIRYSQRELDEQYMQAVESGDEAEQQRMVDEAALSIPTLARTQKGKRVVPLHLYHGTPSFGFTQFMDEYHDVPFIYTSTNRTVSAHYAGDNHYAFVRRINKRYDGGNSIGSIIKDAESVWGVKYHVATDEEKTRAYDSVREQAVKVADKLDEYHTDINLDWDNEEEARIGNAIAWVENLFWTMRDSDISSLEEMKTGQAGYLIEDVLFDIERYKANERLVQDWKSENYKSLSEDQKRYLSYLTGYELGDAAIDIEYTIGRILANDTLLTAETKGFAVPSEIRKSLDSIHEIGAYDLYGDLGDNPFEFDANGAQFWGIKVPEIGDGYYDTDTISKWAYDNGYTSVIMHNIYDYGDKADNYVFFNSSQLKSADPITYDDDGNVIPLTERFNPNKKDIRYSQREIDDQYMAAVESGDTKTQEKLVREFAKASGFDVKAYHQTAEDFNVFNTDNPVAGRYDSETPNGIFFKTNDHDIGLDGKKQKAVYLKTGNVLDFADRKEANKWYREHIEGYASLEDEMKDAMNPIEAEMNTIEDQMFADNVSTERYAELDEQWNSMLEQMRSVENNYHSRLRELLNEYFLKGKSGYNSIHLGYDGHRYVNGKRENVETYILFENTDVKSADPITYDDDGNVIPLSQRFDIKSNDVRQQQRIEAITDSELLQMASEDLALEQLTDGERTALNTFNKRLAALQALQEQRTQLGQQYREQQFEKGGDRKAAAQTLARMKTLDGKIEKAQNDLLSIQDKQVLKRVLQQARQNLESIDRQKARELVRRYRDRRNNAEAIRKYRARINKDASDITNWIIKPNGKDAMKNVPAVIREPIVKILQSIDRSSKRLLKGGAPTKADMAYLEQMKKLRDAMSTHTNTDTLYTGYTDLPEGFMETLNTIISGTEELAEKFDRQFVLNQMTAEELKDMADFVTVLKNYIHKASRSLSLVGNISDLGDSSIEDMSALQSLNARGPERFLMWQTMRPIAVFDRFGRGGQKIFKSLMKGQNQIAFDTVEMKDWAENTYTAKEAKRWTKELITVKLGGEDVQMPISYAMGLYELSKRKNAEGHLYGNGVRIATFKNGRQKISDQGHRITPQEIATLKSQLNKIDPRIIEVADTLQQYMAEKGAEWGNYVSVARFGIEQFTEQDYYPIASDGTYLPASADEKPALASLYALLNMSFTKDLKENANNRAMVYDIFDVFANHMSSMAQYHSFALPVLDSLKWLNYQQFMEDEDGNRLVTGSVREQMARLFGRDAENGKTGASYAEAFVTNILKAINGTSAQGDSFDTLGMKALHAYNVSRIAYNVRVVMQQPMAITRAAMVMSPASISKALARPDKVRANIQEMESKNGIAAWKGLGFYDVNVSRSMTELIKHDESAIQKVNEFGLLGAEVADKVTWAVMWQAAKNEVQRKTKLTEKDAGYWDAVNEIFDETIYRTQVVDSVLTKNEYLRSKSYFARATGSFMNEPMTTYSMLASAYDKFRMDRARGMSMSEAWKKNGKNIARTAAVYSVSAILLSVVQAVADAWRDDDRYETYSEKWWEAFTGNIIDELVPFNNLPMFSDVWNFAKKMASLFGVDTYGSDPRQLWLEFGQELYDGTKRLIDLVTKPDEAKYTWYGSIYKLLGAASGLTGMPLSTTTREVVSAWNNTVAHFAPSLRILDYNPGAKNEIKYAYADGYLTKEEALQLLTDPEVMNDEVLDENDAYWLVKGWTEGESTSKYGRLYKAMLENAGDFDGAMKELTTHGVKEKDAISQVKSTVGKWYRGEEETTITRDQAKKMLINYVGMKEADAEKLLNEWTMKRDTGIAYGDMKQAYLDGDLSYSDAVNYRVKYGGAKEEDAIATVVKWNSEKDTGIAYDDVKQAYLEGSITYDAAVQNRVKYGGADEDDAEEAVAKWNVEKETGYTYDNMKEAYMSGAITYDQAVNYRVKYGNVSRDTAMKTVNDWKGEKASGYAKDDVDDAFMKGKITSSEALKAYLSHGYDSDEAHQKVELLEFRKKYPAAKDIKYNAMRDYKEYCEADGIPVDTFVKVWEYNSKTKADVDANGNSINGSKRVKVLAYIDELPISDYEKDSLYYACGYAPSTLKNAPWHQR